MVQASSRGNQFSGGRRIRASDPPSGSQINVSQSMANLPNLETYSSQASSNMMLLQMSYETLIKQLYGIPLEPYPVPEYLIINGLKVNFIPFQNVTNLQIERWIIDPVVQPWAGPPGTPNRIITIFTRNGLTYLVKARYDSVTNQVTPFLSTCLIHF